MALVFVLLLGLFAACRPTLDAEPLDEFLLRYFSSKTRKNFGGEVCTATQDYTQSFDLSSVDLADSGSGFKVTSAATGDQLGASVAGSGDFNGDGINDIALGAPGPDRVYIIYGRAGMNGNLDLSSFSTADGITFDGNQNAGLYSDSVSFADINGDGFDEVLVGNRQMAYYHWTLYGRSDPTNLIHSSLPADRGFYTRFNSFIYHGWGSAGSGDINGDGIDDLIIGSYDRPTTSGNGSVTVLYGKTSGWSNMNVASLSAPDGFFILGESATSYFSQNMTVAGDLNGDGVDDLIVGARYGNTSFAGGAFVIYGTSGTSRSDLDLSAGLGAADGFEITGANANDRWGAGTAGGGDFNGDGVADFAVSSPRYNGNAGRTAVLFGDVGALTLGAPGAGQGFTLDGTANEYSGYSIAMDGDVNGDGRTDLLVGAYRADNTGGDSGSVYLIFGRGGMPNTGVMLSAYADGTRGIRIDGPVAGAQLGRSLSLADVNGDGCDDLLMGAPFSSGLDYAFVVYGGRAR